MNMPPIVVHRKSGKAAARLVAEAREDSRKPSPLNRHNYGWRGTRG